MGWVEIHYPIMSFRKAIVQPCHQIVIVVRTTSGVRMWRIATELHVPFVREMEGLADGKSTCDLELLNFYFKIFTYKNFCHTFMH